MNYYVDVLKKYTVFSGRAARKEYWMFALWNFIIAVALTAVSATIVLLAKNSLVGFVVDLYALAVLLPNLGVFIRRMHDTGRTGWWIFIGLIPIIGAIVLLVFLVQDSKPGDNQYGPNPKGVGAPQATTVPPSSN
jgi:uncharacterized membrane protein YhaH (DUF805 family)